MWNTNNKYSLTTMANLLAISTVITTTTTTPFGV